MLQIPFPFSFKIPTTHFSYFVLLSLLVFISCSESNDHENCSLGDLSTTEQARVIDFVDQAVDFFESNPDTVAFKAFNDPQGNFIDGELYIFVIDLEGNTLAHGYDASLIGVNNYDLQDINGTYIVREIISSTETNSGWSCYFFEDPETNDIQQKYTYGVRSNGLIVASGTYIVVE